MNSVILVSKCPLGGLRFFFTPKIHLHNRLPLTSSNLLPIVIVIVFYRRQLISIESYPTPRNFIVVSPPPRPPMVKCNAFLYFIVECDEVHLYTIDSSSRIFIVEINAYEIDYFDNNSSPHSHMAFMSKNSMGLLFLF